MALSVQNNYKIKIVALVLAMFIWFFVVTENDYESLIDVPIFAKNVPEGKVILNRLPKWARVRVKGTGKDLIALALGGGARIDLDLFDTGSTKSFDLRPKDVFLSRTSGETRPSEVLMPDSVLVILDVYDSRKVRIHPNVNVTLAPGFTTVNAMILEPDSVLISGPKSLLDQLTHVETVAESYSDIKFDLNENLDLTIPESDYLELEVHKTQVFLDVQQLIELSMSGVPVRVRNAPSNLTVYVVPSTVSLVLEGGGDLLAQIDREDIVAYIDYLRIQDAPGLSYPAVIEPPPGVIPRDAKPTKFKLVFEHK